MINQRHPDVAGEILTVLSGSEAPSIRAVLECGAILREADFEMPSWAELADGARPNQPENPADEPTNSTHGWQRDATLKLETKFFQEQFWPILSEPEQAQMRSQSGPVSFEPFTSFPTSREARFDSQPFRVLLLRRLRLHLPVNVRRCRCGRLLDPFGHHRSACATAGVLGKRGFALEFAAARMCREAGGKVMTNVLVRELDLSSFDNRLEAVAWKWLLTVLKRSVAHSWQLTPLSCAHCARMELTSHVLLVSEAWHCRQLEPAKCVPTQSWW